MHRASCLSFSLALLTAAACSDSSHAPLDPGLPLPDPLAGRMAFEQACSTCHASHDGFDLKTFGFTDTTIIRRAVKHVDSSTARNIVAYIHSVSAPVNAEKLRLFQPKGATVASDVEFANALFGRDVWPDELNTASLAAIDPRNVQITVKLPVWADEAQNLDWMPDMPLPASILNYSGGLAAGAIAGYRAAPTKENLTRAVNALKSADRAVANAEAPCLLEDTLRVQYRTCFEVRRWTATLVALHMLHYGMNANLGDVHDVWWDVGNAARKSRADRSVPIANAEQNWASWMFLGWSFDPSKHSSSYLGGAFRQLGFNRQATFIALRSMVARPKNSTSVYEDLLNTERFAPNAWAASAVSFGLRHLNERLVAGDRPTDATMRATAISQVNTMLIEVAKKVTAADKERIISLAQPVLQGLQ